MIACMITATKNRPMTDQQLTYRWHRGAPLFGLIGLYALGFLVAAQPDLLSPLMGKVAVAMYFLAATLFCLHLYRFRIILEATSIRSGSFFLKRIEFADIVRAEYVQGQDSGRIVIYARNGVRIGIGENLEDFRSCIGEIKARLPRHLSIPHFVRTPLSDVPGG